MRRSAKNKIACNFKIYEFSKSWRKWGKTFFFRNQEAVSLYNLIKFFMGATGCWPVLHGEEKKLINTTRNNFVTRLLCTLGFKTVKGIVQSCLKKKVRSSRFAHVVRLKIFEQTEKYADSTVNNFHTKLQATTLIFVLI